MRKHRIWYGIGAAMLLGVGLVFVFFPAGNGDPAVSAPTPPAPSSNRSTATRLFSTASPWNVAIGPHVQLDPNSSGMVRQLAACCHVPTLFKFGMPLYTSTASDPLYTVQDNGNDSLFEANQPIHIPNTAAPSPGSDHWLFIYDQTKHFIFEMWQAQKDGSTWTTNTGNVYSPSGDGVHQIDGSVQSGNGASYFGGVVTEADMAGGLIPHALALATAYSATTWRYPMNASDGQGTDPNALPLGARLQLDPSVDCQGLAGASVGEKLICQALQTYGGYIRDTGGVTLSMYFEGEDLSDPKRQPPDGSPGNAGRPGGVFAEVGLHDGKDLSQIPWEKLRVLNSWKSFTALSPTLVPPGAGIQASPGPMSSQMTPTRAVSGATYPAWFGLPAKRKDEE